MANEFEKTVRPVILRNGIGNCSACMFRNSPKLCEKLSCEYDTADGYIQVYWLPRHGFGVSNELVKWFTRTPDTQILETCKQVLQKSL